MLNDKFCKRLRLLRLERGLSQENMAEMLNLSLSGYAKIERCETEVSLARVEKISEIFNVNLHILLDLDSSEYLQSIHYQKYIADSTRLDKFLIDNLLEKLERHEAEIALLKKKVRV